VAAGEFDPAQCGTSSLRLACFHEMMETTMTLETILVVIAVTMMFGTLAVVLGWADRYTRNTR
jgi:hypothetical protein